jgi:hypothetical protein
MIVLKIKIYLTIKMKQMTKQNNSRSPINFYKEEKEKTA